MSLWEQPRIFVPLQAQAGRGGSTDRLLGSDNRHKPPRPFAARKKGCWKVTAPAWATVGLILPALPDPWSMPISPRSPGIRQSDWGCIGATT